MDGLRSIWRRNEPPRISRHNEHMSVAESLLSEVDYHIQELDQALQRQRRFEQRSRTGVDYSWLISEAPKPYKIPQLERLELEELCMKLEPCEYSKVVMLFRNAVVKELKTENLPRIMRSCVLQALEQRPKQHSVRSSISDWVNQRTYSLVSLKIKPPTRIKPATEDIDIEMQTEKPGRSERSSSMPNFSVTSSVTAMDSSSTRISDCTTGAYPV
ncbi:protein RD3-like [Babylonia areolata]|uniref:protein RD3-like n=1 Tax=Babylonia areolata TaxID=304850 RepID=UPI003FD47F96